MMDVPQGRVVSHGSGLGVLPLSHPAFGPQGAAFGGKMHSDGRHGERRKWPRLPLAIPVFVRSRDDKGKELLEFATALNVSAGGMLLAVRRGLPASAEVLLEIPSAPLASLTSLPKASRNLRAKALRNTQSSGCHLLGVKFARPLLNSSRASGLKRRKVASTV
jgi:hypothetical protein